VEPSELLRRVVEILERLDLLFVAAWLLIVGVSIPLVLRRVRPNGWYGVRVPATFADEWVWYEANAKSGRDFIVLGVVGIALAVGLRGLPPLAYTTVNAVAATVGALVAAIVGVVRARRLLRERRAAAGSDGP